MGWLPWQDAVVIAVVTAAITLALAERSSPVLRGVTAWTRELTVMFALYGLWQLAGDLSLGQPGDAINRGREVARIERWAHLPSEASIQRMVLGDRTLIWWMNVYYAGLHVAALGICLIWLFVRHRDRYPAVRNVLAAVTGFSLLVQFVPVAPPRLVPGLGLIDTGHVIGPSVYPSTVAPGLDQLSAMPSLHVGWAVVVAGAIIYALRSPWRWLAVIYPALTWWIVIVTGNHYWADGLVELVLCGFALLLVRILTPAIRRLSLRPWHPRPVVASIGGPTGAVGPAVVKPDDRSDATNLTGSYMGTGSSHGHSEQLVDRRTDGPG
jgi:PAP2 superfamily